MLCSDRTLFIPASIPPAMPSGITFYPNQPVVYGLEDFQFERGEKRELFPGGFQPDGSITWESTIAASEMPIYEGLMNWQQRNKVAGIVQPIPLYDFYKPQVDVGTDREFFRVPSTADISNTDLDGTNSRIVYWRAKAGYLIFRFPDFNGGQFVNYEATFYESRALLRSEEP